LPDWGARNGSRPGRRPVEKVVAFPETSMFRRPALLVALSLIAGGAHATSFALRCSGPITTVDDGFGAREIRRERQPTTLYVIDDVAKRIAVVPEGRAPNDLCFDADHCSVEVTGAAIGLVTARYLGVAKLSSRLAIDRHTGRGMREQATDLETVDPIRVATALACEPTQLPAGMR